MGRKDNSESDGHFCKIMWKVEMFSKTYGNNNNDNDWKSKSFIK